MKTTELAGHFGETFENLAPIYREQIPGYLLDTWEQVPGVHQELIIGVCSKILGKFGSEIEMLHADAVAQLLRDLSPAQKTYWTGKLDALTEVSQLFEHHRHKN